MTRSAPQSRDKPEHDRTACPCQSLVDALRAVARDSGSDLNRDDLIAALGMCWSPLAAPAEADMGRWPMYARDAFLPAAGRLFGLTVRDLHPPEAARGLEASAEFAQHFDASYRPLICRALENDQPVLAWQGWPNDLGMNWGIIRDVCEDGVGLVGVPLGQGDSSQRQQPVALVRPPVQLYVVEEIAPRQPDANELIELVMRHADTVLSNALAKRVGVVTGADAYDVWIERLDTGEERGRDTAAMAAEHFRLVSATLAGCESGIRFLERHRPRADEAESLAESMDLLRVQVTQVVQELRIARATDTVTDGARTAQSALARAREATRAFTLSR